MSSSWAKVRSVNVLAFLCGWVGGLRDLDEALQEDGLFAREVRLGDWGGSSTVCSHSGDGLRESLDLMTCVPFPLFLPAFSFLFFPPILMSIVMNVKGMHHAATFTTAMSRSQITAPSFKEKIMGRRQRGVDAVRAPCACGDRS